MFTGHATDQNRGQVHVDNIKLYPRETRGVQRRVHTFFWYHKAPDCCAHKCASSYKSSSSSSAIVPPNSLITAQASAYMALACNSADAPPRIASTSACASFIRASHSGTIASVSANTSFCLSTVSSWPLVSRSVILACCAEASF